MAVQRTISAEIGQSRIGQTVPVIIDGPSDEPGYALEGRTRWDAPEIDGRVLIRQPTAKQGEIIDISITDSSDYDLFA